MLVVTKNLQLFTDIKMGFKNYKSRREDLLVIFMACIFSLLCTSGVTDIEPNKLKQNLMTGTK